MGEGLGPPRRAACWDLEGKGSYWRFARKGIQDSPVALLGRGPLSHWPSPQRQAAFSGHFPVCPKLLKKRAVCSNIRRARGELTHITS